MGGCVVEYEVRGLESPITGARERRPSPRVASASSAATAAKKLVRWGLVGARAREIRALDGSVDVLVEECALGEVLERRRMGVRAGVGAASVRCAFDPGSEKRADGRTVRRLRRSIHLRPPRLPLLLPPPRPPPHPTLPPHSPSRSLSRPPNVSPARSSRIPSQALTSPSTAKKGTPRPSCLEPRLRRRREEEEGSSIRRIEGTTGTTRTRMRTSSCNAARAPAATRNSASLSAVAAERSPTGQVLDAGRRVRSSRSRAAEQARRLRTVAFLLRQRTPSSGPAFPISIRFFEHSLYRSASRSLCAHCSLSTPPLATRRPPALSSRYHGVVPPAPNSPDLPSCTHAHRPRWL
ncbi:hypothetical protein BJY59DRAFT_331422 [Rhodotorula toruloides]